MTTVGPLSLKDRLAARRLELQQERTFDLPVPGYEDVLVARYRPLDYREQRKIGLRHEKNSDVAQAELNVAADTLISACQGVFAKNEDGSRLELGRWSAQTARDQFGVDFGEDTNPTARQALFSILAETNVVQHFADWAQQTTTSRAQTEEAIQGESQPSQEG